jgi:hypothetical protein
MKNIPGQKVIGNSRFWSEIIGNCLKIFGGGRKFVFVVENGQKVVES